MMTTTAEPRTPTGRQIPIVCPGHTRPLAELQFCHVPDENRTLLVSACHDRKPMLRDGATGDWIGTFEGHKGAVWSCRLDPSGCLAASASGDFSVKVWDAITGHALTAAPWGSGDLMHKHIVKSCDFSPDSTRLATGGHEGLLRIYNLTSKKQVMPIILSHQKVVITKVNWWTNDIVVAAGVDGSIRFWNISQHDDGENETSEPLQILQVDAEVRDMELCRIASTGQEILTVAAGKRVYFFDLIRETMTAVLLKSFPMPIHFHEEGGAALYPVDGTKFVAGGSDPWVRIFDFETGNELECLKGHHGPIRCLRFAPNGQTFATGSEDGTIRLWKTDS